MKLSILEFVQSNIENEKVELQTKNEKGLSLIHIVCEKGHLNIDKELSECWIFMYVLSNSVQEWWIFETDVYVLKSCEKGTLNNFRFFLSEIFHIDINTKSKDGDTLLHCEIFSRKTKCW